VGESIQALCGCSDGMVAQTRAREETYYQDAVVSLESTKCRECDASHRGGSGDGLSHEDLRGRSVCRVSRDCDAAGGSV
jgi:hypothetical protein